MFLAFFGEYRGHAHPHESPPVMLVPLAVLALLSLAGGFCSRSRRSWEPCSPPRKCRRKTPSLMAISAAAGVVGILLAWLMYVAQPGMADALAGRVKGLYTLVYNKYFVDEIYDAAVVKPLVNGSRAVLWKGVDAGLIDGMVNGVGARARNAGRRAAAAAIGQYPQLRHLGVLGCGAGDCGPGGSREASDEPADGGPHPAAGRRSSLLLLIPRSVAAGQPHRGRSRFPSPPSLASLGLLWPGSTAAPRASSSPWTCPGSPRPRSTSTSRSMASACGWCCSPLSSRPSAC